MAADLFSKKAPTAAPVVLDTFDSRQIREGVFTAAHQSATLGIAFQAGFDYMFSRDWGTNLDVKEIFLNPKVHVDPVAFTAVPIVGHLRLDPFIIGCWSDLPLWWQRRGSLRKILILLQRKARHSCRAI